MPNSYNKKIIDNAKHLRRNMTKEERHLWYDFLRDHQVHFYKQRIIGNYIADFYCPRARLVIELDGSQHYENDGMAKDEERTSFLEKQGIRVVRIPNNQINQNFRGVCEYLDSVINLSVGFADTSP